MRRLRSWKNALKRRLGQTPRRKVPSLAVNDVLYRRALETSADFIEPHLPSALMIRSAEEVRALAIRRVLNQGLLLEFGVNLGDSINQMAKILAQRSDPRPIYGFDAFRGLSEDWFGKALPKQTNFNRGGKAPRVRRNVRLIIGWIEDTLAPFLVENRGPIAFLHIDTDTYTPCRLVLELCRARFLDGTIILLDEHHGYPNWQNGEFKALNDILRPEDYSYLAFGTQQAVIRIKSAAPSGLGDR